MQNGVKRSRRSSRRRARCVPSTRSRGRSPRASRSRRRSRRSCERLPSCLGSTLSESGCPTSAPRPSLPRPCTFATSEWPRRSRQSCCGHSRCRRACATSSPAGGRCCTIPSSPPSWGARTVCSSRFSSVARRPQSFRSRRRRRSSAPSRWCRSIRGGPSAKAKFVVRSRAREHPEPGDFLAAANQVVVGEIAPNKFITMRYLTVDPATGAVACGCAGHPWPRLVTPDGDVAALEASGLALGIDPGQSYDELREQLPAGGALVLYTDGVIEARRGGEPYGDERLDALLAAHASLPAAELARAVVDDCRAFTGGDLTDDCAVVVIRRT